jgi:hypothetical protein
MLLLGCSWLRISLLPGQSTVLQCGSGPWAHVAGFYLRFAAWTDELRVNRLPAQPMDQFHRHARARQSNGRPTPSRRRSMGRGQLLFLSTDTRTAAGAFAIRRRIPSRTSLRSRSDKRCGVRPRSCWIPSNLRIPRKTSRMISIVQGSPTTDKVRAIEQVMVSICCQRMLRISCSS